MYMMAKHLHLTAVGVSVFLFIFRFMLSQFNSELLTKKWLKILPHVVDTLLLASAIWLCFILGQFPFLQGWLTFKVVGLIAYILMGMFALKWGRNAPLRWIGLIANVAITKQPLLF